jgi:uncharacterized iron-regulated membrane protein
MKTDDERQLLLLKGLVKDAVGKASGLADVFVEATGRVAAEWIGKHVQSTVRREHEHTLALGTDKLKELKADVAAAQEAAPAATKKALKDLPWAFRSAEEPAKDSGYSSSFSPLALRSARRAPDSVDKRMRVVFGEAGRILDKYGYRIGDERQKSPGYRYPYGLDLSDEASAALDAAAKVDGEVMELRKEIREQERKIGEARAAAAWDDA